VGVAELKIDSERGDWRIGGRMVMSPYEFGIARSGVSSFDGWRSGCRIVKPYILPPFFLLKFLQRHAEEGNRASARARTL